jgi:hypothetical protein
MSQLSRQSNATMEIADAFIGAKRMDLLYEDGLISPEEKLRWDNLMDRRIVSLDAIEAFFEKIRREAEEL